MQPKRLCMLPEPSPHGPREGAHDMKISAWAPDMSRTSLLLFFSLLVRRALPTISHHSIHMSAVFRNLHYFLLDCNTFFSPASNFLFSLPFSYQTIYSPRWHLHSTPAFRGPATSLPSLSVALHTRARAQTMIWNHTWLRELTILSNSDVVSISILWECQLSRMLPRSLRSNTSRRNPSPNPPRKLRSKVWLWNPPRSRSGREGASRYSLFACAVRNHIHPNAILDLRDIGRTQATESSSSGCFSGTTNRIYQATRDYNQAAWGSPSKSTTKS